MQQESKTRGNKERGGGALILLTGRGRVESLAQPRVGLGLGLRRRRRRRSGRRSHVPKRHGWSGRRSVRGGRVGRDRRRRRLVARRWRRRRRCGGLVAVGRRSGRGCRGRRGLVSARRRRGRGLVLIAGGRGNRRRLVSSLRGWWLAHREIERGGGGYKVSNGGWPCSDNLHKTPK